MSVRGWSADDDPYYPAFINRLRDAGTEVLDVYVPAEGHPDLAPWSRAVAAVVADRPGPTEPLHLLGYCLGGHILLDLVARLTDEGRSPAYVGLVDCWLRSPAQYTRRGIYGRYGVNWPRRIRHQAARISAPDNQRVGTVVRSWLVRGAMSTGRAVRRGRMSSRRPGILNWHGQHLAYDWDYRRLTVPVHLYNASGSIDDNDGDPSMGLSRYLAGGYRLCVLADSDHRSCLAPPHAQVLMTAIDRDRVADI